MASDRSSEFRALLAEHFLLRHLPPPDLERLAAFAKMQSLGAGEPVFMKGDPAAGMMVVVSGRVRITSSSADGKEMVLNIINPGEVFGEIALIDGVERTADATAAEATELLLLERRDFLPYLERHPDLSLELLTRISQVASIFSAARRRFCYKNHEVVACMERWIWHTRWVNRNRGAFGSILTAA